MSDMKKQVVDEIHKPARKTFNRRRVIIKGLNDLIQGDLVEMIPYAKINKGIRYILVVINVFSKYVWAEPVKRKTGEEVTRAMKKILLQMKTMPKNLQTDLGKEFYNKEFKELMSSKGVNHYSTFSTLKASVVERVNRTLKSKMWKQFSLQGSYKWLNMLPKIIQDYNNTKHSTIGMKPIDVTQKNAPTLLKTVYSHLKTIDPKPKKFKVGDAVRISKFREAFTKGYTPNWSNEVFIIKKVNYTNPTTYLLEDYNNEEIRGSFYAEELQKAKYPDVYLVEKVIRRRGDKVLVKWLGMKETSWIDKNNVV
jgi:Integrase core domain